MPSSVTHNYFSNDVYNKLDNGIKKKIKHCLAEYKVFAQGEDPYFFYDFHLTKKSHCIYTINNSIQHKNINKHFSSIINYINDNDYYSNALVLSYLYGQICHFVLDSTCHPYIIYCSGIYNPNDKKTFKYNGLHAKMEYYIDCYFIYNKEGILPKKYRAYKNLFCKMNFNDELKNLLDNVYYDVYGFKDVSTIYLKCINDMQKFYYVFNYDRFGLKKIIYSIMDKVCGNKVIKKKELSFHIDLNSNLSYLNLNNEKWNHPCIKDETYNYSFLELYDIAMDKAVNIINNVDEMLKAKKIDNEKINLLFGNLDYASGKDCNLKLEFKYFKN